MKSLPKHFIVAIVLFVLVALLGAGLWFWSAGQLNGSLSQREQVEGQLKGVSNRGIFPSRQNLDQLEASTKGILDVINPVEVSIEETSRVFDPVRGEQKGDGQYQGLSANDWKRLLGEKRDELIEMAKKHEVVLPKVFYLGFERYRALSPREEATYELGIELLALNELLEIEINAGVSEITGIKRVYTEDKAGSVGGDGLSAQVVKGTGGWYTVYPFEIAFTAPAKSVAESLNRIVASPCFFIVRFVDIENQKTSVPRKSEVIAQAGSEGMKKNIIPVVGQEEVKVTLRVDLILWSIKKGASPHASSEVKK